MDSVDGEGKVQVSKKDLNDKFMNKNYSLNRKPVRDDFMYSSESSKDIDESAFGNNWKSRRRSGSTSYIKSNNCGLCFTEEMSSDKLVQNPECFHLYHKDWLGSYVQSKLDQMHFPFRCPVRSWTKPLNRLIAGECIDSKDEIAKLDFLNFINRVEKGKRIVFWCAAWKDVFTLQRSQEFKWYLCKGKIYRAKTILEQKDKSFNQQGKIS